ncbi:hypothetical protein H6P81_011680 [Aristolochia fimbriata]|uniref:Protein kinase domain-containing protein n=1 Tax=Aristolochia fimbriata TaxID=158543 RepID=A0AAV7E9M4_ARIFI|nr:hypothetical protein H6P81_011680 [Aristolochia fimbriata]
MATLPLSVVSCSGFGTSKAQNRQSSGFAQILGKDREFIKNGFHKLKSTHLPALSKTLGDMFWLRSFENSSQAVSERPVSWPSPSYPGLSGVDLMMADLEALKAYGRWFYHVSKFWSKPLPEVYDADSVADYFKGRPHILAFRVLEVLSSFATAAFKMRGVEMLKVKSSHVEKGNGRNTSDYYAGLLLKETLLNLGPTFIKVGQSLSTRPDIIGTEVCEALSELHDQIPPFPRSVAIQIIEEELGRPVQEVFHYISDEPVAAASFGQVYLGCTLDGDTVAIKVQRPNLLHAVIRDIYILRLGLGILQKVAKRKNNLSLYADELGKGFTGELDYTLEAANAAEFLVAHARFPFIYVPKVFGHLSRKRVLTMEWLNGENPNDLVLLSRGSGQWAECSESQQQEAKRKLLDMVNKGVEATLVQLLETGILHADPHGGNLRYTPEGKLGFLDFGLLCRMERKHQFAMLASILHIVNSDWASLVYDLTEMDVVRPGTNLRRVTLELEKTLGNVALKDGIPDVKFSRVLGRIWSLALKYHFRMPPYYTLLLRSLASFEGLALAADPTFKTFQAAYPYVVQKLLTDNSPATRRILHSVVFNRQKEFQWQKFSVFIKVGSTRKAMPELISMDNHNLDNFSTNGQVVANEITDSILRLLTSKDGVVLRRLLMTVDPASLIRSMISKEALSYRKYICRALADMLYQWMLHAINQNKTNPPCDFPLRMRYIEDTGTASESSALLYWIFFRDRRLKVIFSRLLNALRKDPILMFRFACTSFVVFISALALSCHRLVASWSEMYVTSLSFPTRRFALNV